MRIRKKYRKESELKSISVSSLASRARQHGAGAFGSRKETSQPSGVLARGFQRHMPRVSEAPIVTRDLVRVAPEHGSFALRQRSQACPPFLVLGADSQMLAEPGRHRSFDDDELYSGVPDFLREHA